jgi:hypothetical protein
VTCTTKAAVSSVPRPVRPATAKAAASTATQAPTSAAGRALACPRRASIVASAPASSVAEQAGTSAVQ